MDMYSGCYIHNMDIYIYIMDLGNLGTNVANGSVRILTYQHGVMHEVCFVGSVVLSNLTYICI